MHDKQLHNVEKDVYFVTGLYKETDATVVVFGGEFRRFHKTFNKCDGVVVELENYEVSDVYTHKSIAYIDVPAIDTSFVVKTKYFRHYRKRLKSGCLFCKVYKHNGKYNLFTCG